MTIIATIGHYDFALDNLQDAEALLQILSRAQAVQHQYVSNGDSYYHPAQSNLSISLTQEKIISTEEHLQRVTDKASAANPLQVVQAA